MSKGKKNFCLSRTLTRNIHLRCNAKIVLNVPSMCTSSNHCFSCLIIVVFIDKHTPRPFVEDFSVYGDDGGAYQTAALEDHIYLDAMGLGMGCCCLQVTFQAQSIDEARFLYDQLTPLTPIMVNDSFIFLSTFFLWSF